jgi:hypothetical protein
MTVNPHDHDFIGYIAIAIYGHFKQGFAVKNVKVLLRLAFF